MRSRRDYIVTKDEVYSYANDWLSAALRLEYEGTKCTASTLFQVLLIAAARVVSIFAACRDLADAPSDQTIRNALAASLPEIAELERRVNRALVTKLPKALRRKARMVAIDLTLIPYHGQPAQYEEEIYRGEAKSGTTHFHAYATAVIVHKGHRYTLALTRVEQGEAMKDVVQRLLHIVRRRSVKIKFLLLDKGFFSRGGPRTQAESPQASHWAAGTAEEEQRLLQAHAPKQRRWQAAQRPGDNLRGQQGFQAEEDRQAMPQEAALRGVESATHAARHPRDVPQTIRH